MNSVVRLLMLSDVLVMTGFGLIEPIMSVFISDQLPDGSLFAAGIASMMYLLIKSIVQVGFARYVDTQNHQFRLRWLLIGTLIYAVTPFFFLRAHSVRDIYLIQALYGLGSGLAYPAWLGLWSTHLDRGRESFEWSLYSTLTGLGTALTAALGAAVAQYVGFRIAFFLVGLVALGGCLVLVWLAASKWNTIDRLITHAEVAHLKTELVE